MKKNKYGSKKTFYDGVTFDSKKEALRYRYLRDLEQKGEIEELLLQPQYPIEINKKHICNYFADFIYYKNIDGKRKTIIEDVKSKATQKSAYYRLKKKLVEAQYNVKITEVL